MFSFHLSSSIFFLKIKLDYFDPYLKALEQFPKIKPKEHKVDIQGSLISSYMKTQFSIGV